MPGPLPSAQKLHSLLVFSIRIIHCMHFPYFTGLIFFYLACTDVAVLMAKHLILTYGCGVLKTLTHQLIMHIWMDQILFWPSQYTFSYKFPCGNFGVWYRYCHSFRAGYSLMRTHCESNGQLKTPDAPNLQVRN